MRYSYQIGFYCQTLQTRECWGRESSHRHLRNVPLSDKASFIHAHAPDEYRSLIRLNGVHKDHTRIQNGMCVHVRAKAYTHLGMKCHFQLSNKLGTLKGLEGFCKHPQEFKDTFNEQVTHTYTHKATFARTVKFIVTNVANKQHAAEKMNHKSHKHINMLQLSHETT